MKKSAEPYSPIESLMRRTDKIKEKSNLRKSQEKIEKSSKTVSGRTTEMSHS